jgi:hypothetical protein
MKDSEVIKIAASYLSEKKIGFVNSGVFGRLEGNKKEVIFPVPETLDPTVAVVEPPDVRVWVDIEHDVVELIPQM